MSLDQNRRLERDALREDEAKVRSAHVSDVSYALDLDIGEERPDYEGRCIIRFRSSRPDTGTFLDFTGREIRSLVVNGRTLEPAGGGYRIALPGTALREKNEVVVEWTNDYDRTGVGFHRFKDPEDGEVYLYTDFEPFSAHRLFPCFDQPDLKAVYDVTVSAPEAWTVIANGSEIGRENAGAGRSRRRFAQLPRFSTYLFAVVAGPYVSVYGKAGEVPLGIHCRRSLRTFLDPDELLEITRQGFAFYTALFGCPYAYGKYDQIFVPEFNSGAMENVGAVTFNENQVFRDPPTETQRLHRAEVVLHELAHMWFGNLVTMRWWDDLWLNESFATYISFLALSEATRFAACWQDFLGSIKSWAYREDQKPTTHPIAGRVEDTEQTFLNFDGITYGKGASVLKQLRAVLGPEPFADGLRLYFRRHAFGNTTLSDFLAALGEAARRDLGPWSQLWLETSGVNTLIPEIGSNGVTIRQDPGNGDRVLRPHTLEAALLRSKPSGELVPAKRITVQLEGERTPLPAFEERTPTDILWCNAGDHAYARAFLDPDSLASVRKHLDRVQDPLTRLGIWGTLWEMLREARLAPADYLALVRHFLVNEREAEMIETVLRNATLALTRYVAVEAQPAEGAALWTTGEEAVARHGRGSDLQRLWGRSMIGFVSDAAHAARAAIWLEGGTPAGIEVDQGMRWRILARLGAFEHPGAEALLQQEAARDSSDRGVKSWFASDVARPDTAIKERAFASFVDPGDRSADYLKHGMATFWWPHQAALLRPFALRYFEVLPGVLAAQDLEYVARGFVRVFFPHLVAGPEVLVAAERLLQALTPEQAVLRRFLLEETDEMRRTLRLRRQRP